MTMCSTQDAMIAISTLELSRVTGGQQSTAAQSTAAQSLLVKAKDCTYNGNCVPPTPEEARAGLAVFDAAGGEGYGRHIALHSALMDKYLHSGPFVP
jgi:hypothetical protein